MIIDFKKISKAVNALSKLSEDEQEAVIDFISDYAVLQDHEVRNKRAEMKTIDLRNVMTSAPIEYKEAGLL